MAEVRVARSREAQRERLCLSDTPAPTHVRMCKVSTQLVPAALSHLEGVREVGGVDRWLIGGPSFSSHSDFQNVVMRVSLLTSSFCLLLGTCSCAVASEPLSSMEARAHLSPLTLLRGVDGAKAEFFTASSREMDEPSCQHLQGLLLPISPLFAYWPGLVSVAFNQRTLIKAFTEVKSYPEPKVYRKDVTEQHSMGSSWDRRPPPHVLLSVEKL